MHVLTVDGEPLAREELGCLASQHPQVTNIAETNSVVKAMEETMDQKPDLLFLDIHLTDESGSGLVEKLTHLKKAPYLVFATVYDQYALKVFQVSTKDYISKLLEKEKITQVIEKASKEMAQAVPENIAEKEPKSEAIPIQGEDHIYLVAPEDIYLVSVEERRLSIFVDQQVYETTGTLNSIEQKLPAALFIKTHRSFILSRTEIQEIQPRFNNTLQVILTNGSKVPVSRSYVKEFKEKLGLS